MKTWQVVVIILLFIVIGYFIGKKLYESEIIDKLEEFTDLEYEPGGKYTDEQTGGTIMCYNLPPLGTQPIGEIFLEDTSQGQGAKGTLFKKTLKTVCYLFPKES